MAGQLSRDFEGFGLLGLRRPARETCDSGGVGRRACTFQSACLKIGIGPSCLVTFLLVFLFEPIPKRKSLSPQIN